MRQSASLSAFFAIFPLAVLNAVLLWYVSPVSFFPDEEAHYAYVERIGRTGERPEPSERITKKTAVLHLIYHNFNPGVGYIDADKGLTEDVIAAADLDSTLEQDPFPGAQFAWRTRQSAASYPPAYYMAGAWLSGLFGVEGNLFAHFGFLRLYSMSLFLLTLLVVWRISLLLFPGRALYQALCLALVGLNIRLVTTGISVNSDILAVFLLTLVVWRSLLLVDSADWRSPNTALAFALSLVSVAVKPQLVLSILFFVCAFFLQQRSHPENRIPSGRLWLFLAAGVVALGGISAWYLLGYRTDHGERLMDLVNLKGGVVSWVFYLPGCFGHMLFFPLFMSRTGGKLDDMFYEYWTYVLPTGMERHYYHSDHLFVILLNIFVVAGLAGFIWKGARRGLDARETFVAAVAAGWWIWIVSITWAMFERETHMQGRYFFPAVGAAMPLLVSGWTAFGERVAAAASRSWILLLIVFFEYEVMKTLALMYR